MKTTHFLRGVLLFSVHIHISNVRFRYVHVQVCIAGVVESQCECWTVWVVMMVRDGRTDSYCDDCLCTEPTIKPLMIYIYIHTYIHTYIHVHTYIHTYIHTYVRTYVHTYIHTYVRTHIHACMHTYI